MCFQNNCILGSTLGQSLSGPFQIVRGEGTCPELFYSLDFQISGGLQELLSLGLLTETMKMYLLFFTCYQGLHPQGLSTSIAVKQAAETGEINKMEDTPLLILRALPGGLGVGLESRRPIG